MPPRFGFPHNQQVWVPLPVQDAPPREGPGVQVFGRLARRALRIQPTVALRQG